MYLLDTNAISECYKLAKHKMNAGFATWFQSVDYGDLYLCEIVMRELERGILLKSRKDPQQGALLEHWFRDYVCNIYADRILTLDAQSASCCAQLHVPNPRPENDAWIASLALTHQLTIVTRNTQDFADISQLKILNPFS